MTAFVDCDHPTHEVVFDGEVRFQTSSMTAGKDYARGIENGLRIFGQTVDGRVVVRPIEGGRA